MSDDLAWVDGVGQAELVRTGEVAAAEVVEAAIARIERVNPMINAIATPLYDKARREASAPDLRERPLGGVPYVLKDHLSGSAGDPMYEGMRFLRDLGWVERADSHVVTRYRDGGFVLVGKANLPELAMSITTESVAYGPCRNPWDTTRSVGGSSGGSAAAVAAGLVPIAHATDAGGSIRIPSSMCGVVGLKPSRGRTSQGPALGDVWSSGSWHVHAITRSIRDTAAVLDVTSGYLAGDPFTAPPPTRPFATEVGADPGRLRVGFMARTPVGFSGLHDECRQAVVATAHLLESLGHHVEEAHPQSIDQMADAPMEAFVGVAGSGVAWMLDRWSRITGREIGPDDVEPYTWALVQLSKDLTGSQLLEALEAIIAAGRSFAGWWDEGYDLLVTPTIAVPPYELGFLDASPENPLESLLKAGAVTPYTGAYNMSGQPAVSLPLHWSAEGLPIGVQLGAAYGREDVLLRVGSQLETAQPWADRRPPVQA